MKFIAWFSVADINGIEFHIMAPKYELTFAITSCSERIQKLFVYRLKITLNVPQWKLLSLINFGCQRLVALMVNCKRIIFSKLSL